MTISIWKKLNFYILLSQKNDNCSTVSSSCHFFCHLLDSGLARINWIRANYKICVEQLICCQKCRANACRAIAIRAVHPHSTILLKWECKFFDFLSLSWSVPRYRIPISIKFFSDSKKLTMIRLFEIVFCLSEMKQKLYRFDLQTLVCQSLDFTKSINNCE